MTDLGVNSGANGARLTLRQVGLAYRQLSASLTAAWAPWHKAGTWAEWHALGPMPHATARGIAGQPLDFWDGLETLAVLEETARRVFGARGCPEGKAGCQPGAVRNCDVHSGEPEMETIIV